ncbi:hypothetical protein EAX62_01950 [Tessaracoccus antarcticus]|uniref:Uncharacterized protein n=2 Tax=Tessaracoccus antarcticus TaxID=2479848 RepID=A0A3M0GIK3_9ACTN|nr:hypothetical protein EAX62_01950 [Tessaracoccus antarcticus]
MTTEEATPEESPIAEESAAPKASTTREPVTTGPLEGEELNAAGVAWFGAFCTGVAKATSFAGPDTTGMAIGEVTDTVVTTYQSIGGSFTETGQALAALDTAMNFENADAFAASSTSAVDEVGAVYTQGSETVAAGTYATEAELLKVVNATEASVVSAGGGDFGLSNLDDTVLASVGAQVPACAEL